MIRLPILLRRSRVGGSTNPVAAYAQDTGHDPFVVADFVNGFYYTEDAGVVDESTMFPSGTTLPASIPEAVMSGFEAAAVSAQAITIQISGRVTFAQSGATQNVYQWRDTNLQRYYGGIAPSSSEAVGRAFNRMNNSTQNVSVYQDPEGHLAAGTLVDFSLAGIWNTTKGTTFEGGTKRAENVIAHVIEAIGDAFIVGDFFTGEIDLVRMWAADLGDVGGASITGPFDLDFGLTVLAAQDGVSLAAQDGVTLKTGS